MTIFFSTSFNNSQCCIRYWQKVLDFNILLHLCMCTWVYSWLVQKSSGNHESKNEKVVLLPVVELLAWIPRENRYLNYYQIPAVFREFFRLLVNLVLLGRVYHTGIKNHQVLSCDSTFSWFVSLCFLARLFVCVLLLACQLDYFFEQRCGTQSPSSLFFSRNSSGGY